METISTVSEVIVMYATISLYFMYKVNMRYGDYWGIYKI